MASSSTNKTFIGGVAVLTVSTAVVKLIGFFYKIPMLYIVGVEGMAYFLAAYHIYTLLFTISTAGLPVAVSILVSKRNGSGDSHGARRVFTLSFKIFAFIGMLGSAALFSASNAIARAIDIPDSALCIRAVSIALVFVAISGAVKGYFQGLGDMKPTAISQIIESLGKLIFGLIFTLLARSKGEPLPVIAANAAFGMSAGVFLSSIYLCITYALSRGEKQEQSFINVDESSSHIFGELFKIAFPITLGAVVINISSLTDTALISARLQSAGFSSTIANSIYSSYGNLAIPIFNLVPSFISPIAISAAPMIAEALQKGDIERQKSLLTSSFRLCAFLALPASLGIAIFGSEILWVVFYGQTEAICVAVPLLTILSPSIFFSCLITVTNASLQSYGKAFVPILSMGTGAALKLMTEYVLVGLPEVNIAGAPVSTIVCDVCAVALNIAFLKKLVGDACPKLSTLAQPLIPSMISSGLSLALLTLVAKHFEGRFRMLFIAVIFVDIAIYLLICLKSSSLTEEIEMLPKGRIIYSRLEKIHLVKAKMYK